MKRLDTIPVIWDTGHVPADGNLNSVVPFELHAFNYEPFLIETGKGCPVNELQEHAMASDTSAGYSLMGCNHWCATQTESPDEVCILFEWSSTYTPANYNFGHCFLYRSACTWEAKVGYNIYQPVLDSDDNSAKVLFEVTNTACDVHAVTLVDTATNPNPYTADHFNSDGDIELYSATDAEALFQSADPTNCPIYDYQLADSMNVDVDAISDLHTILMLEGRTTNII